MTNLTPRHCSTCTCQPAQAARPSAENETWGECVGEAKLCEGGVVRSDARYPDGYVCTGGRHIAAGQYVRCTDPSHFASATVSYADGTSRAPMWWARCGHAHPFGVSCSLGAAGVYPYNTVRFTVRS